MHHSVTGLFVASLPVRFPLGRQSDPNATPGDGSSCLTSGSRLGTTEVMKMTRLARSGREAEAHHVVNRGSRRQPTFADDQDRGAFIGILGDALHKHYGRCVALCLMDNHYHLVLRADTEVLGKVMHDVGSRYTVRFNTKYGFDGALFKGRFFSSPVRDDQYLRNCIRYVNRNPVDIMPPVDLNSYRWSTQRHFLGRSPSAPWMDIPYGLAAFGHSRAEYREFFEKEQRVARAPEMADWLATAGHSAGARQLAALIGSEAGWTDDELAQQLGVGAASTVRSLRQRGRARIEDDSAVVGLMEECRTALEISMPLALPKWITD